MFEDDAAPVLEDDNNGIDLYLNALVEDDNNGIDLNLNAFDLNLPLDEFGAVDFNFVQNNLGK